MGNKKNYKEERFDSFLNKTIIFSSKDFFRKQMSISNKEKTIIDDADYSAFLEDFIERSGASSAFDYMEDVSELNEALKSLSAIEQSVIFLLFEEEISQNDAARILEICSNSVSRIKLRAINKLKKYFKGDWKDEK